MALLVSDASKMADEGEAAANDTQVMVPAVLSKVYSQLPLVLSTPTMAIPSREPESMSLVCTGPEIRADTRVPSLVSGSSSIPVRSFAPKRTGAALAWVKVTAMLWVSDNRPSLARTSTSYIRLPPTSLGES